MAEIDPDYGRVFKTWVDITNRQAKEQSAKNNIKEVMAETMPSGRLSASLFADLLQAVSGQNMEPDEFNETVRQFLAAFDEQHPERAVIMQALNKALMHNGYEWSLTCNQGGQHSHWLRKAEATAPETPPAPTVGKQRKRERTAKKEKGTAMTDRVAA